VDALRLRLEEKESFLNKKTKQLQDLTEEKGTLAGEIRDMKDMLEVKERKINVLQKKVGVMTRIIIIGQSVEICGTDQRAAIDCLSLFFLLKILY
ncbi:hypothetical protein NXF25_004965, partial [Crotalus adamanteus]